MGRPQTITLTRGEHRMDDRDDWPEVIRVDWPEPDAVSLPAREMEADGLYLDWLGGGRVGDLDAVPPVAHVRMRRHVDGRAVVFGTCRMSDDEDRERWLVRAGYVLDADAAASTVRVTLAAARVVVDLERRFDKRDGAARTDVPDWDGLYLRFVEQLGAVV